MMKKSHLFLIVFAVVFTSVVNAQTQNDTIFCYKAANSVTIDGAGDEACWSEAEWYPIENVWMPWNATIAAGDFEGQFKLAWDSEYLYLLVEIVDDSLSDDHVSPTDSWWADDCLEVFIDEDRSKGDHLKNCNAFAYHISTFYDAIDLGSNGSGINYKEHVDVVMENISDNTYLWEIAIKIYDDTYSGSDPEASRVTLVQEKLMGFTLAYCDNDETDGRENFIGSMDMTSATADDNYITADYFGTLILDPKTGPSGISENSVDNAFIEVFPIPASNILNVRATENVRYELYSLSGMKVISEQNESQNHSINVGSLAAGTYYLNVTGKTKIYGKVVTIN